MTDQRHRPPTETFGASDPAPFVAIAEQLGAYFAGERTTFDVVLAAGGTPFRRAVWAALREIPYGETASYNQIAERIGRPGRVARRRPRQRREPDRDRRPVSSRRRRRR